MSHVYNHVFQAPDNRDLQFVPSNLSSTATVPSFYYITDNSALASPIYDQGNLGSCLANAVKAMMYTVSVGKVDLSRLQLYMCFRAIDGSSLTQDTGGTARGGMKAVASYGVCPESIWPYVIENFAKLPPSPAFVDTYKLKDFVYTAVKQDIAYLKTSILANLPVMVGILIYTSFESPLVNKYGTVPMPNTKTEQLLGGHAVLLVGFDDASQHFKFQNSWGSAWGGGGYGFIPYAYILNNSLTSDLWNMYFSV